MNPEDFDINTELNDLKYQLIEEGMENYRLKQKIKKLKDEKLVWIGGDAVVFIIGFVLGLMITTGI